MKRKKGRWNGDWIRFSVVESHLSYPEIIEAEMMMPGTYDMDLKGIKDYFDLKAKKLREIPRIGPDPALDPSFGGNVHGFQAEMDTWDLPPLKPQEKLICKPPQKEVDSDSDSSYKDE